jgi:YidC/Oxa1 family membrane protein insertase
MTLNILEPLYDLVSWVVVTLHSGLTAIGLDADSGLTWGLSIAGLVVIIRIGLIPLFVKQIKSMRNMQVLQPRIREIQKKYKDDRERQSQELMKLYKDTGTNPLSSCLPILAQAPFFFALFKVLDGIARDQPYGVLTQELVESASRAEIFGAPIAAKFTSAGGDVTVQIVTVVMILLMSASQFITQKQLMVKNLPKDAAENNPFLQQQKVLLYVFPLLFAVFGINFPVGVLLYWLVSNLWSMGQQLYVIRRMPSPGSVAHEALEARRRKKAAKRAGAAAVSGGAAASPPPAVAGAGSDEPGSGSAPGSRRATSASSNPAGAGRAGTAAGGAAGGTGSGGGAGGGGGGGTGTAGRPGRARRQPQRVPRAKRGGSKKKR